jgi:hypothetical protein
MLPLLHLRADGVETCPSEARSLNIRGNSYRLKDKLKAGLVQQTEASQ